MKILVIGATRGIGAALAAQAVQEGHSVTSLVRIPEKMRPGAQDMRIIKGDIRNKDSVSVAVAGQDTVCITIGIGPAFKPVTVFSEGTSVVVDTMKRESVRKLVCVTGIGAGDSKSHGGFLYDRIIFPIFLRRIYEDENIQERIVRNSSLEWLIVRPGFLTNGPVIGRCRVLTDLTRIKCGNISRGDVAHFILREMKSMNYAGQTPLLNY